VCSGKRASARFNFSVACFATGLSTGLQVNSIAARAFITETTDLPSSALCTITLQGKIT
jgi:hypothetical protein